MVCPQLPVFHVPITSSRIFSGKTFVVMQKSVKTENALPLEGSIVYGVYHIIAYSVIGLAIIS